MNKIFFEGKITEKEELFEINDKKDKKVKYIIVFGLTTFLVMTLTVLFFNVYIYGEGYFKESNIPMVMTISFFIFFFSFYLINFSFFLKDYISYNKKIRELNSKILQKEEGLINSKNYEKIKIASQGLKYELNINDEKLKNNKFKENIKVLKFAIKSNLQKYKNLIIDTEKNYLLKIVLDGKINGYNTHLIIDELNKQEVYILLNYVTECLKTGYLDTGEIFDKEKDEEIKTNLFLSYKKALEKKYNSFKDDKKGQETIKSEKKLVKSYFSNPLDEDDDNKF